MNIIQIIAFIGIISIFYLIYHNFINNIIKSTFKNVYNFFKNIIDFFKDINEPEIFDED